MVSQGTIQSVLLILTSLGSVLAAPAFLKSCPSKGFSLYVPQPLGTALPFPWFDSTIVCQGATLLTAAFLKTPCVSDFITEVNNQLKLPAKAWSSTKQTSLFADGTAVLEANTTMLIPICARVNECNHTDLYSCPANSVCNDTAASYTCVCKPLFSGPACAFTGYSSGAGCEQDRYLIIPPGPSSALNHSVGFRTARGPCTNSGMALPSVLDQACMQSLLAQIRLHYSADFAFWVNTSQVVNSSGVTGAAGAGMAGMPGSIPSQHQLVCIASFRQTCGQNILSVPFNVENMVKVTNDSAIHWCSQRLLLPSAVSDQQCLLDFLRNLGKVLGEQTLDIWTSTGAVSLSVNLSSVLMSKSGVTASDKFYAICSEVDECALGLHKCSNYSVCNNTLASYTCVCKPLYSGATCENPVGYDSGDGCIKGEYLLMPPPRPGTSSLFDYTVDFATANGTCSRVGLTLPTTDNNTECAQSLLADINVHYQRTLTYWNAGGNSISQTTIRGSIPAALRSIVCVVKFNKTCYPQTLFIPLAFADTRPVERSVALRLCSGRLLVPNLSQYEPCVTNFLASIRLFDPNTPGDGSVTVWTSAGAASRNPATNKLESLGITMASSMFLPVCSAVDECSSQMSDCTPYGTCVDTPSSYQCVCKPLFSGPRCMFTGYSTGCAKDIALIIIPGQSDFLNNSRSFSDTQLDCTQTQMTLPTLSAHAPCLKSLLAEISSNYNKSFEFWLSDGNLMSSTGVKMPASGSPQHQAICVAKLGKDCAPQILSIPFRLANVKAVTNAEARALCNDTLLNSTLLVNVGCVTEFLKGMSLVLGVPAGITVWTQTGAAYVTPSGSLAVNTAVLSTDKFIPICSGTLKLTYCRS
eukprot:scpid41010/ scgid22726/ 